MTTRIVVARTKLSIPTSRRSAVPRPHLAARLDGDYRIGLLSAPPGYGKTLTLASWATTLAEPVAWLSCDAADADPARFVTALLSSISETWPGSADDAFVLLDRDRANIYDAAVAVANDLHSDDCRGVIIVDDLHLAAPDLEVLAGFIGALADGIRLVIGTRSDPVLSLARWRVRGDLLELRTDDLRFDEVELTAFCREHNIELTSDELHRVFTFTEGWPAGVQLAAIALQSGRRREDFLEALERTDRSVADFLLTEVMSNLPSDVTEFLLATSVLDTFDPDLCAAVTGMQDAALMLDRLLAANLFVVPLDDGTHCYRYHHLFAAFLQARLASLGPARLRATRDRASRALEDRGDVIGALQQAMAVEDPERTGEVLQRATTRPLSLPNGGGVAAQAIRMWLHHAGAACVRDDPMRLVDFLIGLISLGARSEAPLWLERVARAHPDAEPELRALIDGAWGECHQLAGQPLAAIARDEAALSALNGHPPDHGLLSLGHVALARAHIQAGQLNRAAAVLHNAIAHPVGSAVPDDVRHPALAAFVAASTGELAQATDLARRAEVAADNLGLGAHEPGRIFALLAHVEVLIERHDNAAAERMLHDAKSASDTSQLSAISAMVALANARAARAFGDEAAAADLLERTRLLYDAPDLALAHVFDEEAARQALRFDPRGAASRIGRLAPELPATRVLLARLALFERDHRSAQALLADLPAPFCRREAVERCVLAALCVFERDVETANRHLREALAHAQPEGLIRTVNDAGPNVHLLLKSYTPGQHEQRYVAELLSNADRSIAPVRRRPTSKSLVEPLSEREATVLRYLCSRLTYPEIAAALYISLNTLKSHVRAVYRKLGVCSRAEAIDSGREHNLI